MSVYKTVNKQIPLFNEDFNLDRVWGIRLEYGLLSGSYDSRLDKAHIESLQACVSYDLMDRKDLIDITELIIEDAYKWLREDIIDILTPVEPNEDHLLEEERIRERG